MGYDGPKRDSGELRLEIQGWNLAQKIRKTIPDFLTSFTHSAN